MLPFVLRRLASGVVLVFVISVLAYTLLYLGGGDIARRILGQNATQETVDQIAGLWAEVTASSPGFRIGSALVRIVGNPD